ncbi:uncharacterized protein JCM15063_000589 [Sporobolomyces koalae]|uniref:uncharacterized protein n=1 Tax=Sporobolomyces koalae TaxID=500713 RepID=UPI00317D19FA
MASIVNKLKGIVSGNGQHHEEAERGRVSPHSPLNPEHESTGSRPESRGRNLVATGRGGAGNMSRSRVREGSEPSESPLVVDAARSRSRSRARAKHHGEDLPVASGRGGLGNVRSDSRDANARIKEQVLDEEDERVEKEFEKRHKDDEHLAGRGGMGNATHRHH